jgi:hypothetical protein
MMTKTMMDSCTGRLTNPQCAYSACHDRHRCTTSRSIATWPQDHDDGHALTNTRRRRSLQAKLVRISLRLTTLRSGEPPLCIKPWPRTLYKGSQGTHLGTSSHLHPLPFHPFTIAVELLELLFGLPLI